MQIPILAMSKNIYLIWHLESITSLSGPCSTGISGKRGYRAQLLIWFCVMCFGGGEGAAQQLGALTCFSNYINRIHCNWTTTLPSQDKVHQLLFVSNLEPYENYSCMLHMGTCTLELPPNNILTVFDEFTIKLHGSVSGEEVVYLLDPKYLPSKNIKLDPPSNLQSNVSSRACVVSWSPPLKELYKLLSYELALKQLGEAWERARHKDHIVGVTETTIGAFEFSPGLTYEIRLRSRLGSQEIGEPLGDKEADFSYRSQWSEWSPALQFQSPNSLERSPHGPPSWNALSSQRVIGEPPALMPGALFLMEVSSPSQEGPISMIIIFSIFLFLISLPYILFKLFPRVKKTFYQNVPSPAAFFRPLYTVHNGNFQTWAQSDLLGPQLRRQGAMDRRVLTRDEFLGLIFQESISHLTYFPMRPKKIDVMDEEDPCKPRVPEETTQKDPESKYLSVEELKTWQLSGMIIDGHGDHGDAQGPPDFPGASQASSLAIRCPPISLKQEDQTPENYSPSNSDYCTLYGSGMPLAPAGELQDPIPSTGQ